MSFDDYHEDLQPGSTDALGFGVASFEFDDPNSDPFAMDASHWKQQTTGYTCAVVSQQMILEQFGVVISEAGLVYEATSGGFLFESGTSIDDIGRLLEGHGVTTHQGIGINSLLNDLAAGHKAILAVDSGEIWGDDAPFEDSFIGKSPDHAIVINGLDMSDPSNPQAVINDPGHPNGACLRIPLDKFMDAWDDSNQFYVATDEAPPALGEDPVLGTSFDETEGTYMDANYWELFRKARGITFQHLIENIDQVTDRFKEEGTFTQAYTASVIKTCTQTILELTDEERNALAREI
tara:strand:+ start:768 stop:1646 length:879 start_codon:yes stop_codon:yes gene_type:complete